MVGLCSPKAKMGVRFPPPLPLLNNTTALPARLHKPESYPRVPQGDTSYVKEGLT